MLLFLLVACRPEGITPLPSTVSEQPIPVDSGDVAGCPLPTDLDADGWQDPALGGRDCDDNNATVGNCDTGEITDVEPCISTPETCDGVDNDCDGRVDDGFALELPSVARVAVAGAFLEDGGVGIAVGVETGAADGAVEVFDSLGNWVVRIEGTGQSASFGSQLASGRDLTGDGIVDLVISAPNATTDDGPNSGRVFVFAGPVGERTVLADAIGWFEGGELDGQPGRELVIVPDLSGDGLAELVVGYYRFAVLFSGAPAPDARLDAALADFELNTGGGPWHFASLPAGAPAPFAGEPFLLDERADLLLGMETYDSGAGWVAVVDSATLALTAGPPIEERRGIGAKLVVVGGATWTLSAGTPVRLPDLATLPLVALSLADGGDLDGDGNAELLVATDEGIWIAQSDLSMDGPFPPVATFQPNRASASPDDVDGDGIPDLVVLIDGVAGVLSGAALPAPCDADGDGLSGAAGDCDDSDSGTYPLAPDLCDGVDNDCDGAVDAVADQVLEGVLDPVSVAVLSHTPASTDGFWLDESGTTQGFGVYAGLGVSGLVAAGPGRGTSAALLFAGDANEVGNPLLLGHAADADLLLDPNLSGDATAFALARVRDGTGLLRTGVVGHAGDFDSDGLSEVFSLVEDGLGRPTVAIFAGPLVSDQNADEAEWLINLPDGWVDARLASVPQTGSADFNGDGQDDLLASSPSSYYGWGRASVFSALGMGVHEADNSALVALYGEPGEALGATLAVGGDLDKDGVGDAILSTTAGTRVLRGAACPMFDVRLAENANGLALADVDGDGTANTVERISGLLRVDGEPTRVADTIFGSISSGVVYGNEAGTYILGGVCSP